MKQLKHLFILGILNVFLASGTLQTKQQIFLQLADANNQLIRGTSVQRGYERQIIVTSFSGVTTGKAELQFTMPSGGASAIFATMQGSKETLPYAVFAITQPAESRIDLLSTVRLETIRILKVEDVNGNTNITIQAARIGTTYYQNNLKTGIRSVSGKTGFDYTTGKAWNSF